MGLLFYPRGGSAHVARNLATRAAAGRLGRHDRLRARSRSTDHPGDARSFYADLEVCPVDMTRALEARDPMAADPPLHPSYEDREDAPDRVFALLDDDAGRASGHRVGAGAAVRRRGERRRPAPAPSDAALRGRRARRAGRPDRRPPARHRAADARGDRERPAALAPRRGSGRSGCAHWAHQAQRLIVLTETASERAEQLLGIDADRTVHVANGFNPEHFGPRHLDHAQLWRTMLTERPRGWEPDGMTLRYEDLSAFERRDAGAPLRRPLHRGQAHPAADRGLRARAAGLHDPRAAGDRRRLPG